MVSSLKEYRDDPRRAITEGGIVCLICGNSYRHLTNTHLRLHGLTSREYKEQFGYNLRRALMVAQARSVHSSNARKSGLAGRIRNRSIFDAVESKRMGGQRVHTLEEALTRKERPQSFVKEPLRDQSGRFAARDRF